LAGRVDALWARCRHRDAGAYRDQELARLFGDCGWTQERIAGRMGQSQRWVAYRLLFGRFIAFRTACSKSESPPKSLTEGHFRKKWSEAKKAAHRKDTEADVFATRSIRQSIAGSTV
jgi:hypothetical protein